MVRYASEYQWSSAAYYCGLTSHDFLVQKDELLEEINDWRECLGKDSEVSLVLEEKNRTGRPFGFDDFIMSLKRLQAVTLVLGILEDQLINGNMSPKHFTGGL